MEKYRQKLFSYLIGMGNSKADAKDYVQAVFISAYKHVEKYDSSKSFSTCLFRVAINHCLMDWRKKKQYGMNYVRVLRLIAQARKS
ncbi:RNA polymerase sigma factor [Brevibacillus laterosporus]|uniref:RNA polymerase sigma factor n=1 Tax=Brevibacillus laterosporus TaxID=1465 RepID=UPI001444057F|nr:sigma-70 family RNA polymerase sigma factor [Brevibacillus laterosporus]